jgi:hypothetical protein
MTRKIAWLLVVALAALPSTALAKGGKGGKKGSTPPAPEQKTHDDEAADFIRDLAGAREKQTDEDATAAIKKLVVFWTDMTVEGATKKPIPGLLAWYARRKSPVIALAGINGLVALGKGPGAQQLVRVVESLVASKDAPADQTTAAFNGLKTVADPDLDVTGPVLQWLKHKDKDVVARTVDVLGGYSEATPAVRSKLFGAAIDAFDSMASGAARGADKDAAERWTALSPNAVALLGILAHQQFADLAAAHKWHADHGHEAGAWK